MDKEIKTSFRTKFILVAGCGVLAGLLLSGAVSLFNFKNLGETASNKIEQGLNAASDEYLQNYIQTTSVRTMLMLNHAFSDLRILGDFMQFLTDHPQDKEKIGEVLAGIPSSRIISHTMPRIIGSRTNHPSRRWSVFWGSLLDADHKIVPEVEKQIRDTSCSTFFCRPCIGKGPTNFICTMSAPAGNPLSDWPPSWIWPANSTGSTPDTMS